MRVVYRVRVECTDCTGVDPMGCNDGEPWYEDDIYASREAAQAAVDHREARGEAPLRYVVEEVEEGA